MGPGVRRDDAVPVVSYALTTHTHRPPRGHRRMFPKPQPSLTPNSYANETEPMVKPTGFCEYDARWLFGTEINLMGIQALGMGLGALIAELGQRQEIVTGHDFRS